ncbi:MAG: ATP-dependent DNA helicase [Proteobacteria bacterium]|nr:MAG: ATP-dependent DNA helicase [Pseudomonadota bacterium]
MPLSKLNQEQLKAATAPMGYNLIIASAGTGKTSTIVARIAYLLENNIKAENILLLTFTNKAAEEMIERVGLYFDKNIAKQIRSGTFHAISYRLLKEMGKNIILKQTKELKMLLKTIHAKRRFDHIDNQNKPYQATTLYDLHSLYQNSCLNGSFSKWIEENYPLHKSYSLIYEDIMDEFDGQKKHFGYVDFNDLLLMMKEQLQKGARISFKEILVDEYQDTNSLQSALVDSFKPKSLFCVGDYDQSIYAFNGANIENIGSFSTRYQNALVHNLSKNYRSSKPILSLANSVIKLNPRLYPKELEVTREGIFEPPRLLVYEELFDQYQGIANLIKQSKASHENIAVIFRNNSSADGIEASLREIGISCKRRGGISFFDAKEVKAMIDLLTIIVNPKDMMAFIHIFEYAKNMGPAIAKEIFDGLYLIGQKDASRGLLNPKEGISPFKKSKTNYQLGLFDVDYSLGSVGRFYNLGFDEDFLSNPILKHAKLNENSATYLFNIYKILKNSKRIKSPTKLIQTLQISPIFKAISNLLSTKRATKKDGSVDKEEKEKSQERILRKIKLLEDLSKNYKDLEPFLNTLTLGSNEMSEGEGVNLLSIHASKGLEFEEVYVVDLMDGRFPNHKLMSTGGGIEEERRLFYVSSTRAKDKLCLSYAKYDKIKRLSYKGSQFLEEAGMIG